MVPQQVMITINNINVMDGIRDTTPKKNNLALTFAGNMMLTDDSGWVDGATEPGIIVRRDAIRDGSVNGLFPGIFCTLAYNCLIVTGTGYSNSKQLIYITIPCLAVLHLEI